MLVFPRVAFVYFLGSLARKICISLRVSGVSHDMKLKLYQRCPRTDLMTAGEASACTRVYFANQKLIPVNLNKNDKDVAIQFPEAVVQRCSLEKVKTCSKFTGEHPSQSVISIKLQSHFIEITLRHGCSLVNLLHIFRTPFFKF